MGSCEGLLLGRATYEMFAASWAGRSAEDDPGAPFMNDSPKYVVSGTLTNAEWNNSTILGAYDAKAIGALKERLDGNLYVSGSGTLVRAMLADGLIDEIHLFIYPLTLGSGDRLFEGAPAKFAIGDLERYSSDVLHLTYRPDAD
jgi:dihydrofolate reductase